MALPNLKDPVFEASRLILKPGAPVAKLAPGSASLVREFGSLVSEL